MTSAHDNDDFEGYFIEFTPVGSSVKVCAVDPLTGLEAVIVGSSLTPSQTLSAMAVRKLKGLLGQGEGVGSEEGQSERPPSTQPPARRGLIV